MEAPLRVGFLKRAVLCLLIGLWCLACPVNTTAQQRLPGQATPKNAALEGIVRQENGRPVIGARILLRSIATNQQAAKISDAQGVFRFIDVPPGAYEVTITAEGFEEFRNPTIQLKAGDDFVLEPALISAPSTNPAPPSFPQIPGGVSNPPSASAPTPPPAPPVVIQDGMKQEQQKIETPAEALPSSDQVFYPQPDRWLITMPDWDRYGTGGEHPYVRGSKWDPFNRNKWKGDVPIIGQQIFLNFTGISDTFLDFRRLPTPSNISSATARKQRFLR